MSEESNGNPLTGEQAKAAAQPGWHWLQVTSPAQDTYGWTDPKTGEHFPATLDWMFKLLGMRTDGTYFNVAIRIPRESVSDETQLKLMVSELSRAVILFEQFRTCGCVVGKECSQHLGI